MEQLEIFWAEQVWKKIFCKDFLKILKQF